jgi:hypothetical protein
MAMKKSKRSKRAKKKPAVKDLTSKGAGAVKGGMTENVSLNFAKVVQR